jgi:5-formaminoimidazole-4-carboxamide-1-(beta)-D-ribofuranosyl 5'-monophosphate synthetase
MKKNKNFSNYSLKNITIASIGSHSALDVARGAKDEGFKTLVITQKGRGEVYSNYYKTNGDLGCVDEVIELDTFKQILDPKIKQHLLEKNVIFVPNRSFEVYLNDYEAIEKDFTVPMFGNKYLLKTEERGVKPNQYDLLDEAQIRYPKQFTNPKKIDRLVMVKILEQARGFERSFFTVASFDEYQKEIEKRLERGDFTEEQLSKAVIEEFLVGVQVNFNYFYSPVSKRLELSGTDTRRQTNLEGFSKIPGVDIDQVITNLSVKYEEAGHMAVTVLESLLGDAFQMGEQFVKATQKLSSPGVIGPFGLQAMILPGPPKKEIVVFDVSPRMPGSPGIASTPYAGYLFGSPMSVGRRVAKEIKQAVAKNKLDQIVS